MLRYAEGLCGIAVSYWLNRAGLVAYDKIISMMGTQMYLVYDMLVVIYGLGQGLGIFQ